jgi:hypothetical protein
MSLVTCIGESPVDRADHRQKARDANIDADVLAAPAMQR